MDDLIIGVLGLQGGFAKHIEMLKSLGVQVRDVRRPQELEECHGLIIPGGESTVMMKQMEFIHFGEALTTFAKKKPVFGTCAGLILISQEILSSEMAPFNLINVTVERNAFGRQAESFSTEVEVKLGTNRSKSIEAIFIRAPRIKRVGPEVQILASFEDEPILVQQGKHLGATFHPELTIDKAIHSYFLSLVKTNSF